MSSNSAVATLVALGLPLFGCSCGASQPNEWVDVGASDSGADIAPDTSPKPDVATSDVMYDPDSSAPAPWYFAEAKGWERVRGVGNCYVYEANDASKLDPLVWESCKDVACTRLKTPWATKSVSPKIRLHDSLDQGIAKEGRSYISFAQELSRGTQWIAYDLTSNKIVRAIGTGLFQKNECVGFMTVGTRGTFANTEGDLTSTRLLTWGSTSPEMRLIVDPREVGSSAGSINPGDVVNFLQGLDPTTTRVLDLSGRIVGTTGPRSGGVVASPSGGAYLFNLSGNFGLAGC